MQEFDQFIQQFRSLESSGLLIQIAQFILWAFVILLLAWLMRKATNRTIADNATRYRAKKFIQLISYILIFILAIITFTGNVQYFTIAIGLISAGLAFALQEVILSVAGWITIISTNIYNPGDRVEVNGVRGDVIDVGITKTTLMEIGEWVGSDNYSGRIVQISNAFAYKGAVFNYSTDFPFVWDEINLPVKYSSDISLAGEVILDIARGILMDYANYARDHWKKLVKKYLIEDANVDPTLTLKLTDNWVEFNLRFVVDYKKRRTTKNKLFMELHKAIQDTKGKVEIASESFEIGGIPELQVDLGDKRD